MVLEQRYECLEENTCEKVTQLRNEVTKQIMDPQDRPKKWKT